MANKLTYQVGLEDLKSKKGRDCLWRAIIAEFLGNVILNYFGCASVFNVKNTAAEANFILIALTFGLAVFVIVHTIAHVSGGHVNPAVTFGMLITGRISLVKGICYIIAQCVGAIVGSALLKVMTPDEITNLGETGLTKGVHAAQGFGMEFALGFILVLVVFGVCDVNRPHELRFTGPLAIGLTVTLGHLAAVDITGSSMNPARSFGSAVIGGIWEDHWIYWVGPILGGIVAALVYTFVFTAPVEEVSSSQEKYTAVNTDDKEMKRLDGHETKHDVP